MIPVDMPTLDDDAYDINLLGGPSALEQMLIELTNRARMDPLGEADRYDTSVNALVTTTPLWALASVPALNISATKHSEDQINQGFFAHINPNDLSTPTVRAAREGFTSGVGENIGLIASFANTAETQARVEAHHQNLWKSQGHQDNMLNGGYSVTGTGFHKGPYTLDVTNDDGTVVAVTFPQTSIMTQKFAATGLSYITGVVIDDLDADQFYDVGEGQGNVRVTAYNEDGAYGTTTFGSGGYSLAVPEGNYTVVFEGGMLDTAIAFSNVAVTGAAPTVKLDAFEGTAGTYVAPATNTFYEFILQADADTGVMTGSAANEVFANYNTRYQFYDMGDGADIFAATFSAQNNTFQKFTITDFDVTEDFILLDDGVEITRKWRNSDGDLVMKYSTGQRDDILVIEGSVNSRDIRFFTNDDLRAIDDSPRDADDFSPVDLPFQLITGSNDSDMLVGSDADEMFFAFKGRLDTVETGGGNDKIVIGSETSNGSSDKDVITDFDTTMDTLVFTPGVTVDKRWFNGDGDLVMRLSGADADVLVLEGGVTASDVMITYVPEELIF